MIEYRWWIEDEQRWSGWHFVSLPNEFNFTEPILIEIRAVGQADDDDRVTDQQSRQQRVR